MVVDRKHRCIDCGQFPQIGEHLRPGDLLVVNDTRVIPARLLGEKPNGGKIEVFLVRRCPGLDETWICLTKSSKPPRPGMVLKLPAGISGEVLPHEDEQGYRKIRFSAPGSFAEALEEGGEIPLPPYIRRDVTKDDRERYQTVFARHAGAVAAPTAGLHFTPERLAALQKQGIEVVHLTLHVGLGTFMPVRVDDLSEHRMHSERYAVSSEAAAAINRAKKEGRRVIAVGTTSTRTLEYALNDQAELVAGQGETDLFITPGFRFRMVDTLITNFHLPRSTLLVLVSAFADRELILAAYERAVAEKFRFFSYGDCMLIL